MKFREKYKRELDKKIDSLMIFTSVSELKYTKKGLMTLGIVGILLFGFAIYASYAIWIAGDSTYVDKMTYAILFGGIVWEFAYFGMGMLYTKTKHVFFEGLYVILGYFGVIIGAFIGAWLTLLELFAKRTNVYHLYKYFYAVVLSVFYTIIMVAVIWDIVVFLEQSWAALFALVDWSFGIWILCYILFRVSFYVCLKIWFKFLGIDSQMVKVVSDEMQIPLYILLIICMSVIWGAIGLNYSENIWMVGFLNASTVVVLWGSVRDKIGETKFEV